MLPLIVLPLKTPAKRYPRRQGEGPSAARMSVCREEGGELEKSALKWLIQSPKYHWGQSYYMPFFSFWGIIIGNYHLIIGNYYQERKKQPKDRHVPPCAVKTCAVRPVFARVVGELRAADPSKCPRAHEAEMLAQGNNLRL